MPRATPLVFALLTLAPSAFAQSAPLELTLAEALRRGREDPPAVRTALARADATSAQIDQARAGYYPTVTASGSASMGFSDQPVLANVRYQSVTVGLGATVTARVPIYDFGRTSNSVEAATRSSGAAREDVRASRLLAMSSVATAYLTVLSDQEVIHAARATIAQREAHLRIAEGLVAAGARPPIERTRAEVDLDVGRLDLTSAEARERNDRATLAAALGIDPLRDVALTAVEDDALRADDDPARASAAAVASRPEFAAARQRVAQAEAQASAARSGRLPTLAAQASGSVNYTERVQGQGAFGVSEQLQGAVTLSWPMFDPTVSANVRVADANVTSARETLAQQSLQVRSAAVQAAINLRSAAATLEQSERLAASAAANLAQANGRYESGAAALLELVDAQAADASARYAVIRARFTLQIARVNVLTATGELERLAR
jgi:outer membrane protein TolC